MENWSGIIEAVKTVEGAVALAMLILGAAVRWLFRRPEDPPAFRLAALMLVIAGLALLLWLVLSNGKEPLPPPSPPVPSVTADQCRDSTITVTAASYGLNCTASAAGNATNSVKAECDGRTNCAYGVNHATLGDQCYGIKKEFLATYECSGRSGSKTETVPAEATGYAVTLTCPPIHPSGSVCPDVGSEAATIHVAIASYGLNCTAAAAGNATTSIRAACDGKRNCAYGVSVETLGDPCGGTKKEFQVSYTCSGRPGAKTEKVPAEANGQSTSLACS